MKKRVDITKMTAKELEAQRQRVREIKASLPTFEPEVDGKF